MELKGVEFRMEVVEAGGEEDLLIEVEGV